MADSSINLLPQVEEKQIETGNVYRKSANVFSIGALLIVFFVVVGLFAYQLFLQTRENSLNSNSSAREAEIRQKFPVEIEQRALVDKLQAANNQLTKNKSTADMLAILLNLATLGKIDLSKVNLDYAGGMSITIKSPSSTDIGKVFDGLTDTNAQKTMEKVILSSLQFNQKEAVYQFTVKLNYIKGGLLPPQTQQ